MSDVLLVIRHTAGVDVIRVTGGAHAIIKSLDTTTDLPAYSGYERVEVSNTRGWLLCAHSGVGVAEPLSIFDIENAFAPVTLPRSFKWDALSPGGDDNLRHIAFSPDERYLFVEHRVGSVWGWRIYDTDGVDWPVVAENDSLPTTITNSVDFNPQWLPDSSAVLILSGVSQVWSMARDTGAVTQLAWSPAGSVRSMAVNKHPDGPPVVFFAHTASPWTSAHYLSDGTAFSGINPGSRSTYGVDTSPPGAYLGVDERGVLATAVYATSTDAKIRTHTIGAGSATYLGGLLTTSNRTGTARFGRYCPVLYVWEQTSAPYYRVFSYDGDSIAVNGTRASFAVSGQPQDVKVYQLNSPGEHSESDEDGGLISFSNATLTEGEDPTISEMDQEDVLSLSAEYEIYSFHPVESVISLTDARAESRSSVVSEYLTFTDTQAQAGTAYVEDTVEMSDAIEATGVQVVEDTVTIADEREASTTSSMELQDTITISDSAHSVPVQLVEDVLAISDEQSHASGQTVESEITLSDAISDGTVSHGVVLTNEIFDTVLISDSVEAQSISQHDVVEHISVTDEHFHKDPGAIAWVMNTETAAPSWYSNWQFVDMVQLTDRVLAVGPEGLVELGADSDAGDEIDAELEYGFMDFGAEQKKRIDAFWFGYTSSDVVEVEVETIDSPPYDYRMQPRNADSPRNNRVRPGKGLNARYWRIKVRNSGGADLAVDSISADVALSARRL